MRGKIPASLYHYQSGKIDYLRSQFPSGQVKLAKLEKLNDPWDGRPIFRTAKTQEEREVLREWAESYLSQKFKNESDLKKTLIIKNFLSKPESIRSMLQEIVEPAFERLANIMAIYSLSSLNNHPLMWGHHASSHTGLCIEYDTESTSFKEEYLDSVIEVEYREEIGFICPLDYSDKGVKLKAKFWEYENEYRIVFDIRNNKNDVEKIVYENINIMSVRSIILGCRMKKSTAEEIYDFMSKTAPHISIKRAVISRLVYGLDIVDW